MVTSKTGPADVPFQVTSTVTWPPSLVCVAAEGCAGLLAAEPRALDVLDGPVTGALPVPAAELVVAPQPDSSKPAKTAHAAIKPAANRPPRCALDRFASGTLALFISRGA